MLGKIAKAFGKTVDEGAPSIYLYNTLGRKNEEFTPPSERPVRMYNCGPTVYGRQHIGNLAMFVFTDILRRMLELNKMKVKQVINITDFGHLSSDGDTGEDKMTRGLKKEGMDVTLENMLLLGEKYTNTFKKDLRALGVDVDNISFPRASDYVGNQKNMIRVLLEKGYAYDISGGIYFDTSVFKHYGELGNIDTETLKEGARTEINKEKRNPADFVLWKRDEKIGWESEWGGGFPGWHIECSAMIRAELGEQIDIHTGGIEHIGVHHNNEIAQSESAIGKRPLSRFWLHRAHIQIDGKKIAKSEGNVLYLDEIEAKGYSPLAYRYWLLTAHYRTPSNFTFQAMDAAQNAYTRLKEHYFSTTKQAAALDNGHILDASDYISDFTKHINNDLDTPGALAVVWNMVKDKNVHPVDKLSALDAFDCVLGLSLRSGVAETSAIAIPPKVQLLVDERKQARLAENWVKADKLRE